jgi:hypothetical protein
VISSLKTLSTDGIVGKCASFSSLADFVDKVFLLLFLSRPELRGADDEEEEEEEKDEGIKEEDDDDSAEG